MSEIIESTTEESQFTPSEVAIIESLGGSTDVALRPRESCPDVDTAWAWLERFLLIHQQAEKVSIKLRQAIGKFLLWAKAEPDFYRHKGFATYTDFINEWVVEKMGFSRASLYQARSWAENLPQVSVATLESLGPTKANLLASFTKDSDPSFPEYMAEATNRTAVGFQKWAVERNFVAAGDTTTKLLAIRATEEAVDMWKSFTSLPEVRAYCGSEEPYKILTCMIQECMSEWNVPSNIS